MAKANYVPTLVRAPFPAASANTSTNPNLRAGHVSNEELVNELARARAVLYGPFDEDYGYATIEAFLAEKPVITCRDSGEAARIVEQTAGGWIVEPSPQAVGAAIAAAYRASDAELAQLGRAGAAFARSLSWRNVVDTLVVPYL